MESVALGPAPESAAWPSGGGGDVPPFALVGQLPGKGVSLLPPPPPPQSHILDLDGLAHQGHQQHTLLHGLRKGVGIGDLQRGWCVGKHLRRNLRRRAMGQPGASSQGSRTPLPRPFSDARQGRRAEGWAGGARGSLPSFTGGNFFCTWSPSTLGTNGSPEKKTLLPLPLPPGSTVGAKEDLLLALKSRSQKLTAAKPTTFSHL